MAAATSNFEKLFGWSRAGKVQAGYRADLLVLDANPTVDIRNAKKINTVILSGRLLDREKLLARQ